MSMDLSLSLALTSQLGGSAPVTPGTDRLLLEPDDGSLLLLEPDDGSFLLLE